MKRLVDEVGGVKTYHHGVHDGKSVLSYESDVDDVLSENQAQYNAWDGRYTEKDSRELGKHVAAIPSIIALKWLKEYGIDVLNPEHAPAVARMLNDPEWRYLRTSPGNLVFK